MVHNNVQLDNNSEQSLSNVHLDSINVILGGILCTCKKGRGSAKNLVVSSCQEQAE